jgi:hypothetical protein
MITAFSKRAFSIIFIAILHIIMVTSFAHAANYRAEGPDPKVCKYVLSYANRGELDKILIPSAPRNSTKIKEPKEIATIINHKWLLDINNDGIMERVFISGEGSLSYGLFSVYKLEKDEEINPKALWDNEWSDKVERWSASRDFIKFHGVTYILGTTKKSLDYLLYMSTNNEIEVACEFGREEKKFKRIKISKNDELCNTALNNNLEYIKFTEKHYVTQEIWEKATSWRSHPRISEAALIDIYNTGHKKPVISVDADCLLAYESSVHLAVLTEDRKDLDRNFINMMPSAGCGADIQPLIFKDKTYFAVTNSSYSESQESNQREVRRVVMLDKDEQKTICDFEIRPINFIVRPAIEK